MKSLSHLSALFGARVIALSLALGVAGISIASDTTPPAVNRAAGAAKTKNSRYPIHGKLAAVDNTAKTLSLQGASGPRVYKVTSDTKFTKNGKPATLSDGVVGEDVGGYVEKLADGSQKALSVRFGAKPGQSEKSKAEKKPAAKNQAGK